MYYVYILQSLKDKKLYIGFTVDLRKRLKEHNDGLSFSTKGRRPFILICYEAYRDRKDAMVREKFLKTGWGRNYIERVLRNYFQGHPKS
ncbi:MAG: GIY-YIG nuclease family protein [Candidatus Omnitrophica bacterium]|nr:GIY-YIG nuclease family protein [Candidatus Omnitrophota bacterium]